MKSISTLTEFIESGGLSVDIADMGRRIGAIPRETFIQFEQTETAYPFPLQQKAWFALTLADPKQRQIDPMIWFIHFPLDEQGKLALAARDEMMQFLMESLGGKPNTDGMQGALENNPYAFQPKQERLAVFHARLTTALNQPASRFYGHARAYYEGELGWEQWSFIGYQGIADLAARLNQDGNTRRIAKSIPSLPPSPLEALCHCLESEIIPDSIAKALAQRAVSALRQEAPNPQILTAVVRGLSQARSRGIRNGLFQQLLDHPLSQRSDILAAIAGRAWEVLEDAPLRQRFLERLAENEAGQDFFNGVLSDLLYLPATRVAMQRSLRDPNRSSHLSHTIGNFFAHVRGG
ncbi:MAG: hypothetical protein B6D72_01855 [gamma proteobacterium symbiont of Ctena orbiculata]|nr:MAG: hypothetical protein B6D72_01855 [gamma proteobacterium symbiont of Ctena orbiculata]PVV15778.1 MAG: hypothetical protein B6D82_02780 [gamma proteobacterium symbiont of Ctena orbiculata]PVV19624.1 MAG: hypothetical protein B6D74_14515 [gamma proteobacterium symbiont of Ctena orbiculata]